MTAYLGAAIGGTSCSGVSRSTLLFTDDEVLLASSESDLQHLLGRFVAKCKATGIRVSAAKSEEFKYLGVLFTVECRMDWEIDRRIDAVARGKQALRWTNLGGQS